MRIVYFGTAPFAVPALRVLAPHIVKVISQPDKPSGRKLQLKPSPVKLTAEELGLPVETPEKARDPEFVNQVKALQADMLVVAAYGQILPVSLLETAIRGGINLHGSILPKYRGAAPIQRAILEGEQETGVTLMQMEKGLDSGDIIAISRTIIDPDETYGELHDRLAEAAARLIAEWAPKIASSDYPRTPQDHSQATFAPKIDKQETLITFDHDAQRAYNIFRAFTPTPGSSLSTSLGLLKLIKARRVEASVKIGHVSLSDGILVGMKGGALELLELQAPGKKPVSGRDFWNGFRLFEAMSIRPEPEA